MTDWITQRAREIVDNLTQGDTYLDRFKKAELVGEIVAITAEAYARGCVDQHERTKAEAVKVAESYAGSTPPRYTSGISKGASPSQQADNSINAMKIRSREIAAAIEKMERPV